MEIEAYCKIHKKYVIQWIRLVEQDIQFGCIICYENQKSKLKESEVLFLHDVFENPLTLLLKLKIKEHYKQFYSNLSKLSEKQIMEQYQQWESNLREFQKQIDNIIVEQKKKTQNLIENYKMASQSISENMKQANIIALIKELRSSNNNANEDIFDKIQKKVKIAFEELQKDDANQMNTSLNEITNKYRSSSLNQKLEDLRQLDEKMKEIMKQNLEYNHYLYHSFNICSIEFKEDQQSKLISRGYLYYLFDTIECRINQKLKLGQRIYQSSQDGLTSLAYWNKVNGKKNLLLILKSKNAGNYICGAYINCQFNGNSNSWQPDNTASSFIFSYTHNEIYPLKQQNKSNAMYCQQNSSLIYIGSQDLYIQNDFINGFSNLGSYYQWDKYENKQSTHLFGGNTPNIEEGEVYEISM